MGVLTNDIYNDELHDLWVEVTTKISKQYPQRHISVRWEIIFRNGLHKEESYDVSLGANETDWSKTTINDIVRRCMETLMFSVDVFTTYYNQTIEKIVIK